MKTQLRHFFVALLPLIFGLAASWGFAFSQDKCGRLVGPIFAPKCHWIQLEYQLGFQMAGTLLGCLIAAVVGASLERRSRGRVTHAEPQPGGAMMKAPLVLLMMVGLAGRAAAQDTTAKPAPAPAAAAAMSEVAVEAVLARSVMDRAPQDTGSAFPDTVGTIVLWMRATGAGGQTLHHVWFFGDTEVGDVPLTVGGSPWRTWSRKTVPADAKGAWHVEIRDEGGNVLKRIDFTVGQ